MSGPLYSLTKLLKKYQIKNTAKSVNDLLLAHGILEEKSRPSTKDPLVQKKYKALTEKGLKYGVNVHNDFTAETQPNYYDDTFPQLLQLAGLTADSNQP